MKQSRTQVVTICDRCANECEDTFSILKLGTKSVGKAGAAMLDYHYELCADCAGIIKTYLAKFVANK